MNSKIALIILGLAAVSAAEYNLRSRATAAPVRAYGQPAEVEEVEEEPVQYKAALKSVVRAPIRVSEPAVSNYGSSGYSKSSVRLDKEENERVAEEQSKNAKYSFGSAIDDGIMDHSHVRQESREGGKVEGSYAYSDGYFKRVVNYVADENGYRVVSEDVQPISESGPKIDLVNGKADVHTQISGVDSQYSVTAQEINVFKKPKN